MCAAAFAAVAALTVAGCASGDGSAPEPADTSAQTQAPAAPGGDGSSGDDGTSSGDAPVVPADFPEDFVLVPDAELLSASGGSGTWTLVKSIDLVDQASAAVTFNERSFSFTVDEFVDGDEPSWVISNDTYIVSIDVVAGDPYTMTFRVDER